MGVVKAHSLKELVLQAKIIVKFTKQSKSFKSYSNVSNSSQYELEYDRDLQCKGHTQRIKIPLDYSHYLLINKHPNLMKKVSLKTNP